MKGSRGTHSAASGTKANFVKVGEVLSCLSMLDAAAGRSPEIQGGVKNGRFSGLQHIRCPIISPR